MSSKEAAFIGAGKKAGLELWRIENMSPKKIDKVDGKFYTGDSYILLSTVASKSGKLSYAIHFWLGSETTQDESGTAAYKTVELDDSLGGGITQFREVQGSESDLFLSYFKNSGGIQYVKGGIASGFNHVDTENYAPRLLQCKGARTVRVITVPFSNKSITKGDVYILDIKHKIYVFNGPKANRYEKAKGVEVARRIDTDDHNGRCEIIFLDDNMTSPDFWGPLGGVIDPESLPDGEDDAKVVVAKIEPKLFILEDSEGFEEVPLLDNKLRKAMLTTTDVFLVHGRKLFLWIGKTATLLKKREATRHAVNYIKTAGLPANTQLERVSEGVETNGFKAEFFRWPVEYVPPRTIAATREDADIDIANLSRKKVEAAPIDDGSGKLEIWVVQNFVLEPVDPSTYGQFFGGDSYVILYSYKKNYRDEYMLYFWLGDKSTADEKGSAALMTTKKSDELGGRPVQVRVVQGKEPIHFRLLFKGKMIIHEGGKASGFKNKKDTDSYDVDGIALFRVHGADELSTRAIQVPEKAESLNSDDCFVLITPQFSFSWYGVNSTQEEKAMSKYVSKLLSDTYLGVGGRILKEINEGKETADFWSAVGGKGEYTKHAPMEVLPKEARLFECSDATGSFTVNEVAQFTQTDLNDEDIYMLDTFTTVFLWIGSNSREHEKIKANEFAQQYIREIDDGRDLDCPILKIHSAEEPTIFTAHFPSWDEAYAENNKFTDPYQTKVDNLNKEKADKLASLSGKQVATLTSTANSDKVPTPTATSTKAPTPTTTSAKAPTPTTTSAKVPTPTTTSAKVPTPTTTSAKAPTPTSTSAKSLTPTVTSAKASTLAPAVPQKPAVAPAPAPKSFATPAAVNTTSPLAAETVTSPPITTFYSYEDISQGKIPGIDASRKEQYLDDSSFCTIFGMDKTEFSKLPGWKKTEKKKALKLF